MKLAKSQLLLIVGLLLSALPLTAQNTAGPDQIELRSGKVVSGTIIEYQPGSFVKMQLAEGHIETFPAEAVMQIRQAGIASDGDVESVTLDDVTNPDLSDLRSAIYLKDGGVYYGEILEYEQDSHVMIKLEDGATLVIDQRDIDHIGYEGEEMLNQTRRVRERRVRSKPVYAFRERGTFHCTSFAFSFGRRDVGNDILIDPFGGGGGSLQGEKTAIGFNIQHVSGYQFNRWVGTGLGVSYDGYDLEEGEAMLTLFGHYRAYLTKKIVSPFVSMNVGYGFALTNSNQGIVEAEGGLMLHPELGLRLGASAKANFTMTVGYRIQDAFYTQEFPFNGDIEYRDLQYRRFYFSLGLLF